MAVRLHALEAICVRQANELSQVDPDWQRLSDAATVLLFSVRHMERLLTESSLHRTAEQQAEIEAALVRIEPWLLWLQREGKRAPTTEVVERLLWINRQALAALRLFLNSAIP